MKKMEGTIIKKRIASKEWLHKVANIPPYVIDEMYECADKVICLKFDSTSKYSEMEVERLKEVGVPITDDGIFNLYWHDGCMWSEHMFAECEQQANIANQINFDDVLEFIERGEIDGSGKD